MSHNSSSLTPSQVAHYNDTRKPLLIGSFVVLLALSNSAVIARGAGQWKGWRRLLLEDYLIFIALIISDAIIAGYLSGTSFGLGLHMYRVIGSDPNPPQHLVSIFKIIWVSAVLNGSCFLAIKLSILYTYRRLFLVNQRWLKIAWWANVIYAVLWAIGSTLFYILQCGPVDYYWNRMYLVAQIKTSSSLNGHCESNQAKIAASLITSTISDFAILLLPVSVLWNLQISTRKKVRLVLLFSLGLCACAASLVRIALAFKSRLSSDATWDLVEFIIWSSVEECIGIICACVPTLASLFQRLAMNRSQQNGTQSGNVRPKYTTVDDNAFDQESLYGLRSSDAQYELSAPSAAKNELAVLANAGENKWQRTVEVAMPERARQQMPGKEIKVDTKLEWRSDRLSSELRL